MKSKDQTLLEEAYAYIKEASGTYAGNRLASDAKHFSKAHTGEGPQRPTAPDMSKSDALEWSENPDPHGEIARIKVIANKAKELIDDLQDKLTNLYGGKDYELPPEIDQMFDAINQRLQKIVPNEDF